MGTGPASCQMGPCWAAVKVHVRTASLPLAYRYQCADDAHGLMRVQKMQSPGQLRHEMPKGHLTQRADGARLSLQRPQYAVSGWQARDDQPVWYFVQLTAQQALQWSSALLHCLPQRLSSLQKFLKGPLASQEASSWCGICC